MRSRPIEDFWISADGDDPLDEFDSTSGSKLLVDQTGRTNCTPVATEGADKSATVP